MLGMPGVHDEAFAGGPADKIDIVFVFDNSGSMADDIDDVQDRIDDIDAALVAANVDPRYGLVSVGEGAFFLQDLVDFTTFTAGGSPFSLLTADKGNPEDGSAGVQLAMSLSSFRGGGVPICIILITDEDDDTDGFNDLTPPFPTTAAALADMLATNPPTVLTGILAIGAGNTALTYSVLVSGTGGTQHDIAVFRANPDPVIDAIVEKIIEQAQDQLPVGGEILPINTTALLLAGAQSISMWMIPVVISGAGIGMFVIMRSRK